ncbi:hypothetical protein, partial [Umezakia ovalisporum]|nr:hypothetical protein [Umezakia ovalisporum FSS-62]
VCLEAASLGKPILCFDKAGGEPEFVEDDCGFIVPYLDLDAADMNLISLRSLRYSNPNAKITLVCDINTVQSLETCKHPILQEANQTISVKTLDQPASFRNRFIKTSLREHLSGDFLYLDADTVIRGDLTPIFNLKTSFAAAPNHSGSGDPAEMPFDEKENFDLLGWALPTQYYVICRSLFYPQFRSNTLCFSILL